MGTRRSDEQSPSDLSAEPTSRFLTGIELIWRGEHLAAQGDYGVR